MKKCFFVTLAAVVMLAASPGLYASQQAGSEPSKPAKAPAKASKVLHPEMKAEKGSFAEPAAKLGEKPAQPWTETTIAAGVDKKPLPGKPVTVRGEIIDYSCYLQLGKHGEKHKACGQQCLKAGQPIGLLTRDGTIYLLMAEEHDPRRDGQTTFRDAAVENFAQIVEVTGTQSTVNGQHAIYVQGYVKK